MQDQGINCLIVGPNQKTVISMDIVLYLLAKQLQLSCSDLGNIILSEGKLYVVKAQLLGRISMGVVYVPAGMNLVFLVQWHQCQF